MERLIPSQGHKQLPDYHIVGDYPKNPWWQHVSSIGKDGQEITRELLKFDPQSRLSARQVGTVSTRQTGVRRLRTAGAPTPVLYLPSSTHTSQQTTETSGGAGSASFGTGAGQASAKRRQWAAEAEGRVAGQIEQRRQEGCATIVSLRRVPPSAMRCCMHIDLRASKCVTDA